MTGQVVLMPGQNVVVPEGRLEVSVASRADVDVCALMLSDSGVVTGDADLVFYNAPVHPSGAVKVRMTSPPTVVLDLASVRHPFEKVVVAVSVDPDAAMPRIELEARGSSGSFRFVPAGLDGVRAVVAFEVYRRGDQWKLRAVGQGWASGLAGLATAYGLSVDEDPAPAPSDSLSPPAARPITRAESLGAREGEPPEVLDAPLSDLAQERLRLSAEVLGLRRQVAEMRSLVVQTRDEQMLQEMGFYEYSHPLDTALDYKERLKDLRAKQKQFVRESRAIRSKPGWAINGSLREGAALVKDFGALMLRAYNTEADNCARSVKAHNLSSIVKRLDKVRDSILKHGSIMGVAIDDGYHELRVRELRLVADHQMKLEEEREAIRAERERQREDAKANAELKREEARLEKERTHYENVLQRLRAAGDTDGVQRAEQQIAELGSMIQGVRDRAANTRAGYVYVISNLGAFGTRMVKIGMTRRLEPMDRVRELGNASVPFRFDVHALVFSKDAVGLETALHQRFAAQRVNRINLRREFFFITPAEVKDALVDIAHDHVLEFTETAEALEWRQSQPTGVADDH